MVAKTTPRRAKAGKSMNKDRKAQSASTGPETSGGHLQRGDVDGAGPRHADKFLMDRRPSRRTWVETSQTNGRMIRATHALISVRNPTGLEPHGYSAPRPPCERHTTSPQPSGFR